jgi:hypothetical protein
VQEIFEIPNDSTEPTGNDVILNILFYKWVHFFILLIIYFIIWYLIFF